MRTAAGVLTHANDPSHKQKKRYSLTEQGIELFPLLANASVWGLKYLAVSPELGARAKVLADGGPPMWVEFMEELREEHLGEKRKSSARSIRKLMQNAYDDKVS